MTQKTAAIAIDYTPAIRQQARIGRIIRGQSGSILPDAAAMGSTPVRGGSCQCTRSSRSAKGHCMRPISERNMVRLWHRLNVPWPPVEYFTGGPLAIFHATDFVLAPNKATCQVVTVHDLAFLFYPDAAIPSLHRYLNVVVPRSCAVPITCWRIVTTLPGIYRNNGRSQRHRSP
ncbi:MAG: hypothetical protein R2932_09885 [Caldilineaceae bacterium]